MSTNKPQMLMWNREHRVFRSCEFRWNNDGKRSLDYELEAGLKTTSEISITADSLHNLASIYLGPTRVTEKITEKIGDFKDRMAWRASVIDGIIESAAFRAESYKAPYFGLTIVQDTDKNYTYSGKEETELYKMKDKYLFSEEYNKRLERPITFTLHPTVNLYVPRD